MKITKRFVIQLLVLVLPFIILLVIYPYLPDQVPTGKHLAGNNSMPKSFVFLLGFLPYLVYLKAKRK